MSSAVRGYLTAAAVYVAATVALFLPLILRIRTVLPHDLGDPLFSTWVFWWNAHRVPFTHAWWDGLMFYPMHGALGLSDHRLGLALIASPIQWLGGSAVLAYNVTLLLSFPLSALAADALAWSLTRSRAASYAAGFIFGFNPYRMTQLEHIELLAAWWLPIVLLALHEYHRLGDRRWLALAAVAWTMQGLSSGYYLLYLAPLVALWAVWFAHGRWTRLRDIAVACAAVAIALGPLLLAYQRIQDRLVLTRSFTEITTFSADLVGFLTPSPLLAAWHAPRAWHRQEGELFPGSIALALLIVGLAQAGRVRTLQPAGWRIAHAAFWILAVVFGIAAVRAFVAPGAWQIGALAVSNTRPDKPLAIAVLFAALAVLTTATLRDAFRRRSPFAFYAMATVAMASLALGPAPTLLGRPLLYRGPYAALMVLPGFSDRFRVPARFAMIAVLTLSVAAALVVSRLRARTTPVRHAGLATLLCVGILADGWLGYLPIATVPAIRPLGIDATGVAAVVDLPLGDAVRDLHAMYDATAHGRPVVNGYSGYEPHHYAALRLALDRYDESVLPTLAADGPLLVRVDRAADPTGAWTAFVARHPGVSRLASTNDAAEFLVPASAPASVPDGVALPIRRLTSNVGSISLVIVSDGDLQSRWVTPGVQRGGEQIDIELDRIHPLTGLALSLGPYLADYPRALVVSTSMDGAAWIDAWRGRGGGPAVRAILDDARSATIRVPLGGTGRFVRVRQIDRDDTFPWSVAELAVLGR